MRSSGTDSYGGFAMNVRRNLVSYAVGFIFALGLGLSGMTQPQKIIGFLNPWDWDPSLLFVMIGAVGVHALTYPLIRRRPSPLLDQVWHIPARNDITGRLALGSAIFGIGWGLGGFCPGPALTSIFAKDARPLVFVTTMIVGMIFYAKSDQLFQMRK
jgi:uncharacterized membrane protein YedE/YeeE